MKIAYCTNHFYPSIGGAEIVSKKITDHFSSKHDVHIITRKTPKHRESTKILEYTTPNDAENILKKIKPDLVFVYSDVFDCFRFILENNWKLILAPCGANWLYKNPNFVNLLYKKIDNIHRIIVHSQNDRDYKLFSADKFVSKLSIIPNGVDIAEFDNNQLTREDLLPEFINKRWILNVSNFFPGKGQLHMVPVLRLLPNPQDFVYIQVSSDTQYKISEQLESRWNKHCSLLLKKQNNIDFVNIKNPTREQTIGFFKNSNVFCMTSEKEVAPLVLLESMAASLPWVSTDVGNAKLLEGGKFISAIKDSKYHNYFDNRIYKFFASSIIDLINTPCIAENGRLMIENKLNWGKILPQYDNIIETINQ